MLALAALAALVATVLLGAVAGGGVFFDRDIHLIFYPQAAAFARAVAEGAWPVWDPFFGFGQPMLANPETQVLYPLTWLQVVLTPWTYYTVFAIVHLLLGAAGVLFLARRLGASPAGSLVGAAAWAASGPVLSMLNLWHHFAGAAWLPWVLLAAESALARPSRRAVAAWAAAWGLQVLAGSGDACAMTGALVLLRLLAALDWRHVASRANATRVAVALSAGALALAVSAGQWVPTLEAARASSRSALSGEVRTFWSVSPGALLQAALPVSLERLPADSDDPLEARERLEPFLASLYLGGPGLGLVLAALLFPARRRLALALSGVALGGVVLALGRHAPVYDALVSLVPPLGTFRYPMKTMLLAAFAWALLSAFGFDAWRCERRPGRAAALGVLLGVAALAVAAGWIPGDGPVSPGGFPVERTWLELLAVPCAALLLGSFALSPSPRRRAGAAVGLATLLIVDLVSAHRDLNPTAPATVFAQRPDVLELLGEAGPIRVHVWDYRLRAPGQRFPERDLSGFFREVPVGFPPLVARALGLEAYLFPPVHARWGVYGSYSRDLLGLFRLETRYLSDLFLQVTSTPGYLRLLRLGGVQYVLALHDGGQEELEHVRTLPAVFREPIRVFRVPRPLPRSYVVGSARAVEGTRVYEELVAPYFDPSREILLAAGPGRDAAPGFAGSSRVVALRSDRVRLEAELSAPGYVVLLDAWDPGWKATVDGRPAPVLRANAAFRAVEVPPGRHVVEMVYRPAALLVALGVSALAFLTCAVLLAGSRP